MSVDQVDVIDYISTDRATGDVLLTVSDHLDWKDTDEHLSVLQRKIERYVDFIQTGQLLEQRPDASGRGIVIDVILKHAPSAEGLNFFAEAGRQLDELDVRLVHRLLPATG